MSFNDIETNNYTEMPKSDVYVCPRCGYEAVLKKHMRNHLFNLKKSCPNRHNVDLTEEIKQTVLDTHFYYKPVPIAPSVARVDEAKHVTYNTMNNTTHNVTNLVNGLNTLTKLEQLLLYYNKSVTDINDLVEAQHQLTVDKLDNDEFTIEPHLIDSDKILMCIDDMVKTNGRNHEEMNVIYDEMLDRIKIYCDDKWEHHMIEPGLKRIIEILRSNYLNPYEAYLYNKLFVNRLRNGEQLSKTEAKLEEYYKFLYIFDHKPYVYNQSTHEVIIGYHTDNPYQFNDYGMKIYNNISKSLGKQEISHTKKLVLDIVKRNHKVNLKKLNESIIELINVDEEFKTNILKAKMLL